MSGEVPQHYWNNLLALTTKASAESGAPDMIPRMIDEDNRKWLENVMADLVRDSDPGAQLDKVIESLHCFASSLDKINEDDIAEIEKLADLLEELLEGYAILSPHFVRKGGLFMIETFLNTEAESFESIRIAFGSCLVAMTQNNPQAQHAVVEAGLVERILALLANSNASLAYRLKLLSCISAVVRADLVAMQRFVDAKGGEVLSQIVQSSQNLKLCGKAARTLISITFDAHDFEKYASIYDNAICNNYVALVCRYENEQIDELEFIRRFMLESVNCNIIHEKVRSNVLACLGKEEARQLDADELAQITQLKKKFAALRSG